MISPSRPISRLREVYVLALERRLGLLDELEARPAGALAEEAAAYKNPQALLRDLLHRVVDAAVDQAAAERACLADEPAEWLDHQMALALGKTPREVRAFIHDEAPRLVNLRRLARLMAAQDWLKVPELTVVAETERGPLLAAGAGEFRKLLDTLAQVADNSFSVLIIGQSGTGKELVARRIHELSPFAEGPFVPVDCASLPEGLIEAELFGHQKGAFTGALRARPGKVEMAAGGTLFLDEVAELPLFSQVKLLRVLQERVVERLGGGRPVRVSFRLISATSRDLEEMMTGQRFRTDLYYRLATLPLYIPPLKERPEDLPALIEHYLLKASLETRKTRRFSARVLELLKGYDYPGNVRELINFINHAVALSRRHTIDLADLPGSVAAKLLAGRSPWFEALEGIGFSGANRAAVARLLAEGQGGYITNADLRKALNCSDTTAKTALNRLAVAGLVIPEGRRGGRRYQVVEMENREEA